MPGNLERFLKAIGEEALLDDWQPQRFRVKRLPDLFSPCPMCAGSTDVTFGKPPFRAFCTTCGQKWDLKGEPVEGCRGDEEVWKKRLRYVEERKKGNGNGHKYAFYPPINLEEFTDATTPNFERVPGSI